jgi:hypothetical protein
VPRVKPSEAELDAIEERRKLVAGLDSLIERKSKPRAKSAKNAREEMLAMVKARDWKGATGNHFVELYAWCHEKVYGVEPGEIRGTSKAATTARKAAISMASRMLNSEFEGAVGMANYLHWAFKREVEREKWRVENGREGGRITWRLVFAAGSLLTDYRIARARQR